MEALIANGFTLLRNDKAIITAVWVLWNRYILW